ncbi:MAG TPA: TetR/AcrR family transcriptional regulator [Thermohalobaculum sp.]|nr:TetR/AcrR family transcriptional regulator [Thermohalobaculum sp.]
MSLDIKAERSRPARSKGRRRQTRAERSESTLRALFQAAAEVVGEVGYADASVARITSRAKVAQGTFYNYFASRQDLFDQLLPRLGASMLEYIRDRVDPDARGAEREVQRLRAYFQFLDEHPEFYRILYEAETLAPTAHRKHMEIVAGAYVRGLRRSWERGEMPEAFEAKDLEPVAYLLLAARGYLSMRYGAGRNGGAVPEWVVRAYAKLVRHGILRDVPAGGETGADADDERG